MAAFFGPSTADLEHLRSAVRALGTTSVPGLAAALSWREKKTEKFLARELARPNTPLLYDPSRRTVRWGVVVTLPTPIAPTPAMATPAASGVSARAPAPVYTPTGLKTLCPHCHVALQSTGSAGLVVCPQCGRLSSARSGGVAASGPVAPSGNPPRPSPAPPAIAERPAPPVAKISSSDRRSQELFAAWVTNQPIPCPKCRTPLRHRGVSEYACPSCGQSVQFDAPSGPGPAAPSMAH
jgi:predicted RNA-binding Zn-ribbon protein involved in translation (DUF1610 family)